jgi:hypothetical protein
MEAFNGLNLIESDVLPEQPSMHDKDFVFENMGEWQTGKDILKHVKDDGRVLGDALALEPVATVDVARFVIAAVHEERVRVQQLKRQQNQNAFARILQQKATKAAQAQQSESAGQLTKWRADSSSLATHPSAIDKVSIE